MNIKNTKEFNDLIDNNEYVVVDFFAEWCGPCKMLTPIFEELAQEIKIAKLYKVNVDDNEELSIKYNVESVPTILFIKKGNVVDKHMGFIAKDALIEKIKNNA